MTYGEFKNRVLALVFSYSIAGDTIASTYNNQADYLRQIPGLLNSAQTYVYQFRRFEDCVRLEDLDKEEMDDMDMYILPEDCLRMKPGLIKPGRVLYGPLRNSHLFERFTDYRLFGGNKLLVPKGLGEKFHLLMEYDKRAVPIPENVPDSYVLKNVDEVNEILPFYVAAHLVIYDDSFRYASFKNEFEDRLNRLMVNPTYVETSEIRDAYTAEPMGWCNV